MSERLRARGDGSWDKIRLKETMALLRAPLGARGVEITLNHRATGDSSGNPVILPRALNEPSSL